MFIEPLERRALLAPTCSLLVTTTSDAVDAADSVTSFREAINCANSAAGLDTIGFNIPGSGVQTISPTSALPTITGAVIIDGYTQPEAKPNTNPITMGGNAAILIELSGASVGGEANGLTIHASGSTVRGLAINRFVGDPINRKSGAGLFFEHGGGMLVEGNYIGSDPTGTIALGNGAGIWFDYTLDNGTIANNTIGGATPAARNLISGNGGRGGIYIERPSGDTGRNFVLGNFIGTDVTGTLDLGNDSGGLESAGPATIGGTVIEARNLISGNDFRNLDVYSGLVQGNFIGTDVTGTKAIDVNGSVGVFAGSSNVIGGTVPGARNVISGNSVGVDTYASFGNLVIGNFIGTDVTGTVAIGNGAGVAISVGSSENTVGGTTVAARNIISGNGAGVTLCCTNFGSPVSGNIVQGNYIGLDVNGAPLGNGTGVGFAFAAVRNTIGGTATGAGNTIAFNTNAGITLGSSVGVNNAIVGNSIFSNGGLGIDLGSNGVTSNDLTPTQDADTGPNKLQNFPVMSCAKRSGGQLRLTYRVPSDPANSRYPLRIEFFKADADSQEGQTYLGFDTFTETDFAAGSKTVTVAVAVAPQVGDRFVATATDSLPSGSPASTSEFSPHVLIGSPWYNCRNPLDVNDDTHISAADPLDVINYINGFGAGAVPESAMEEKPFLDVNGDSSVSPADSLDIINHINAFGDSEGESSTITSLVPSATASVGHASPNPDLLTLLALDAATQSPRRRSDHLWRTANDF